MRGAYSFTHITDSSMVPLGYRGCPKSQSKTVKSGTLLSFSSSKTFHTLFASLQFVPFYYISYYLPPSIFHRFFFSNVRHSARPVLHRKKLLVLLRRTRGAAAPSLSVTKNERLQVYDHWEKKIWHSRTEAPEQNTFKIILYHSVIFVLQTSAMKETGVHPEVSVSFTLVASRTSLSLFQEGQCS